MSPREEETRSPSSVPAGASVAAGGFALVAYLLLAPPVAGDKDSGELTLVLAVNGAAHPTGYPLYTLLGHAFVRALHASGASWAYAANAWSALGGAIAIALLHALASRLVPAAGRSGAQRVVLGLLPVALFVANPVWTVETTIAEVYSWHVAWVAATVLVFRSLVHSLEAARTWPVARLLQRGALWGALCGLGGAHHATSLHVAAPLSAVLVVLLARARRFPPALAVVTLLAACVPLASYAWIAERAAHPGVGVWGNLAPGLEGLWAHATGMQYRFLLGRFDPSDVQRGFLAVYVFPFFAPAFLGTVAAAWIARSGPDRTVAASLAAVVAAQTLGAFGYAAADPTSYFVAPLALALAGSVPWAARVQTALRRRARLSAVAAVGVAAVVFALNAPWVRTGISRRNGYVRFDEQLRAMWHAIPFDRGVVLWGDDLFARLVAYQVLDGEKPDLVVLNPWWLFFPPVRSRFIAEYGFDPVEGVAVPAAWLREAAPGAPLPERILEDIARRLSARIEEPVVLFDGEKRSVRLVTKPAVTAPPLPPAAGPE